MAEKSDVIRKEIEETRLEMGETVDALAYKANVPARTKGWVGEKRDAVTGAAGSVASKVSGTADSMVSKAAGMTPSTGQVQSKAGHMKDMAERNPLGLALAGAAVGFVAGLFAPSTRLENTKLGPISDQVKETAAEAGQEALQHGKEVAQAAARSAAETAAEETKEHGSELSSSLQDKAREVSPH
jgi:gas vesicle protein